VFKREENPIMVRLLKKMLIEELVDRLQRPQQQHRVAPVRGNHVQYAERRGMLKLVNVQMLTKEVREEMLKREQKSELVVIIAKQ
jgi:hypothetical protein